MEKFTINEGDKEVSFTDNQIAKIKHVVAGQENTRLVGNSSDIIVRKITIFTEWYGMKRAQLLCRFAYKYKICEL